MKESNDNKQSDITTKDEFMYAWITLKELIIILWEYMRGKHIRDKYIKKPKEDNGE
jgi:hypothetical protein|tara:strand:- start:183 stop:350 length:168 start_codon:yes stop_codon:yes gene_type:complete